MSNQSTHIFKIDRTIVSLLFGLGFVFLIGCGPTSIYNNSITLSEGYWEESTPLLNVFEISDTTQYYDLYLDIEHSTEYAYENVYVQIETEFPHKEGVTQVLPIDFADKTGKWYGKCGSKTCMLRVVLKERTRFEAIGKYTLKVKQYSRVSNLEGINGLDFSIVESVEK